MGEEMVGFGYKQAWLAVADGDPAAVAATWGLRDLGDVPWRQGIDLAYLSDDRLVIAPPLPGARDRRWLLVTGRWLFPRVGLDVDAVALSAEWGTEVQSFVSHRVSEWHGWSRAVKGVAVREFAFVGTADEILRWRGEPDGHERAIGLPRTRPDPAGVGAAILVGEQDVMSMAGAWSIDPTTLDGQPAPGPLRAFAVG